MCGTFYETIRVIKKYILCTNNVTQVDLNTPLMQEFLFFFKNQCLPILNEHEDEENMSISIAFKFDYMGTKHNLKYMAENAKISFQYDDSNEDMLYQYNIVKCKHINSKNDEPLYALNVTYKTTLFK